MNKLKNDGSSSVSDISNSHNQIRNKELGLDITDNDIKSNNDFISKKNHLDEDVKDNSTNWREKITTEKLFRSTNQ